MNEKGAKLQGLEVHRRDMAFVRGFVTCTNCGCNYHCQTNEPTFCQTYSRPIDPTDTDKNILMAEACEQWVPNGLDRNQVVHPDHTYRYEKWED
jgi:hypothetical protein